MSFGLDEKMTPGEMPFWRLALPFSIVNGVVWGVGIMVIPLLAGNSARAGLAFAMINLGIALGAVLWGKLSGWVQVRSLVFASSLLSFLAWLAISLLGTKGLVPLAFAFGFSSAGIFALSSVAVTQAYPREVWDKYISRMQAFMTGGTVVGLILTSLWLSPAIGVVLLALGFLGCFPIHRYHAKKARGHLLHSDCLKPKMHFSELFTCYFHSHFRPRHLFHLKNRNLFLLNLGWGLALLAVAPVYAIYPLLMKQSFHVSQHLSSLVYALSTAIGVYFFILAGKLSEKFSPRVPFGLALLLYLVTFVFMALGYWFRSRILGVVGFMVMIFAWSFISVGMNLSIVTMLEEDKRAEALGVANSIQSLDNMVGGMAGGALAYRLGDFSIMVLGGLLSMAALLVGLKTRRFEDAVQEKDSH